MADLDLFWRHREQHCVGLGENLQVALRVVDGSVEDEARSLYDWLLLDHGVRRSARIELGASAQPVPGAQGAVVDLVSLILGSGFSAASLGVSVASWRSTRPQQPTVIVERADGSKVTISGASASEVQRLVELLIGEE
ncbi:hypothetical protein OOK12_44040 [Streptomyces sp. NBC_00452]|uniref:effector-associated constant component EACC1 n=1 Tax=Streptomyces sp. NBC_00452 TaxID=2975746 RepID=UPI00225B693F|nr:hypothetical protein [Streptomyces sp. NBC_00452]MCX5063829.1 hypothetical protein [Streptomyces sp. NBC_00452]